MTDTNSTVHDAIVSVAGGPLIRARLADVRAALPGLSREAVDAALRSLSRSGDVALFPIDHPRDRNAEDEAAALDLCGCDQHLAYAELR